MGLWNFDRIPEPEEMATAEEVASYDAGVAERHLDGIDNAFVEHVLHLLPTRKTPGDSASWGLDVGTGPGQIPIKLLRRLPGTRFIGIDLSQNMISCAQRNAKRAAMNDRFFLVRGTGCRLPFREGQFSIVICNSVLHHVGEPVKLLQEIIRVAAPDGTVLIRDLRRPSRWSLSWHLWRHGRHYTGPMRKLFESSVRAAYTVRELRELVGEAGLRGVSVYRFRSAYLGVERAGTAAVPSEPS